MVFLPSFGASKDVEGIDILDDSLSNKVMKDADQARKDGMFCDVTLLVGPGKYPIKAHRLLLTSASGFFRAMFTSKFKEVSQDEVELPQMDQVSFETIINFIYTGKTAITNQNIENISRAANFLEIPKLLEECTRHLMEKIDYGNCIEVLEFADHISNTELKMHAKKYFLEHYDEISAKNLYIMDISIPLLLEILGDDSAAIHPDPSENEERLLQFGMNRLHSEPDEVFQKYLPKLLKTIHLPRVSDKFLDRLMTKVDNYDEGKKIVEEAKDRKLMMQPTFKATTVFPKMTSDLRWAMRRFQDIGKLSIICNNMKDDSSDYHFFGEPAFVEGEPFCLEVKIDTRTDDGPPVKYVSVFIHCMGNLQTRQISHQFEFELVSPKPTTAKSYMSGKFRCKYDTKNPGWGQKKFIKLTKLLANYYDEDTNSCTIHARFGM